MNINFNKYIILNKKNVNMFIIKKKFSCKDIANVH